MADTVRGMAALQILELVAGTLFLPHKFKCPRSGSLLHTAKGTRLVYF